MTEKNLIRDLMTVGVPTCQPDTLLCDLIKAMQAQLWEAVVVLDDTGHAVGWVGEDQLVRTYARGGCEGLKAEDVMDPDLPVAPPEIPLTAGAQIMLDRGVRVLYITHHAGGIEYPAAWLTYRQLLRHMRGDDLADTGIHAVREAPLDVFLRRRDEARRRVAEESGRDPSGEIG